MTKESCERCILRLVGDFERFRATRSDNGQLPFGVMDVAERARVVAAKVRKVWRKVTEPVSFRMIVTGNCLFGGQRRKTVFTANFVQGVNVALGVLQGNFDGGECFNVGHFVSWLVVLEKGRSRNLPLDDVDAEFGAFVEPVYIRKGRTL